MKLNGNKQTETKKEKAAAPKKTANKGRMILIIVLAVAAAVLAASAAGVTYVEGIDTIFPNVTVDGVDIGGLTLSETAKKLSDSGYDDLAGKTVSVLLPEDYVLTLDAGEVCTETPVSDIVLMAWNACKGGNGIQDALTYLRCRYGGMELESGSALTVDTDAVRAAVENAAAEVRMALLGSDLDVGETSIRVTKGAKGVEIDTIALTEMIRNAFLEENYTTLRYDAEIQPNTELDLEGIKAAVYKDAADAYFDKELDAVVPEVVGVSFDVSDARALWDAAGYGDTVYIPLILTEPEIKAEDLEAILFRDQLSARTTSLWGSTSNRINNVTKAAEAINHTVLMPGEEFSYNPTLGERTKENGYLLAGAYSDGQNVQEYGGGICQVSSTLYYCTLYANLKITSRTCHYFPVGYLPAGLDATVSWGGPEFKFVNDREYPIRIVASADAEAHSVTVELWGTDTDGSYVSMHSDNPEPVYSAEFPEVQIGYKVQTYRLVYNENGGLISRKTESLSYYHYHDEDIDWPDPEESEEPEPTETPEPSVPVVETDPPEPADTPEPTDTPDVSDSPEPADTPEPTPTPAPTETPDPTTPVGE